MIQSFLRFFCSFILFFLFLLGPLTVVAQEEEEGAKSNSNWASELSGQPTPVPVSAEEARAAADLKKKKDDEVDENGLTKTQKELIEIDKIVKEKGPTSLITDPALAKRILKAFSKGKGKDMKSLSPFAALPEAEIEALIFKQSAGTAAHDFLKDHPQIITFIVRFLKSEDAFIGLIKIAAQEKKLKIYFGCFVLLTLLSFFFNMAGDRKSPFWKRFLKKFTVSMFFTSLQFVVLYLLFSDELLPTITIAKDVFFK